MIAIMIQVNLQQSERVRKHRPLLQQQTMASTTMLAMQMQQLIMRTLHLVMI
jgi:hypothetical protein